MNIKDLKIEYYRLMQAVDTGAVRGIMCDNERRQAYQIRQILAVVFNVTPWEV